MVILLSLYNSQQWFADFPEEPWIVTIDPATHAGYTLVTPRYVSVLAINHPHWVDLNSCLAV